MAQMQCENCKGYKMKFQISGPLAVLGTGVGTFGFILLFIGLFFWPLLPIAAIIIVASAVPAWIGILTAKNSVYKCRSCGFIKTISRKKSSN